MAELLEESQKQRQSNGGGGGGAVGTKRQRRPSVRLGDLGGGDLISSYYYDPFPPPQPRRSSKQRRKQPSKTQPLGNLNVSKETLSDAANDVNNDNNRSSKTKKNLKKKIGSGGSGNDENIKENEGDFNDVAIGSWKSRASVLRGGKTGSNGKRGNMTSLGSKLVDENQNESGNDEVNRNFEPIHSEEEDREENHDDSPVHSLDRDNSDSDDADGNANMNGVRDDNNGVEKGMDGKDLRFQVSDEMDDPSDLSERNGVKVWLKKLGLQRYAPIFEIHEVDDEVLPLLTLEDLKDMGITAVGSRRKMFCSIQNLNKGFC